MAEPDFNGFSAMSPKISQHAFLISAGKYKSVEEVLQNVSEDNFLIKKQKRKVKKHQGWTVPFLMPNKEEITARLRLLGCLDWVARGNLRRFTSKLHKLGGSRLLTELHVRWIQNTQVFMHLQLGWSKSELLLLPPAAPRAKSVPESCC